MSNNNFFALMALVLLSTACVHHQPVSGFDPTARFDKSFATKTAAVVLQEPKVLDNYKTSSAGETFYYEKVYDVLDRAFQKKLSSAFKKVVVFRGVQPNRKFDFVFYPNLQIQTVYDFWVYGSVIDFGVQIVNSSNHPVGQAKQQLKRSFSVSADKAFGLTMQQIFDPVVDQAVSYIK